MRTEVAGCQGPLGPHARRRRLQVLGAGLHGQEQGRPLPGLQAAAVQQVGGPGRQLAGPSAAQARAPPRPGSLRMAQLGWGPPSLRAAGHAACVHSTDPTLRAMWPDGQQDITEVTKRPLTAGTLFKNSMVALVENLASKVPPQPRPPRLHLGPSRSFRLCLGVQSGPHCLCTSCGGAARLPRPRPAGARTGSRSHWIRHWPPQPAGAGRGRPCSELGRPSWVPARSWGCLLSWGHRDGRAALGSRGARSPKSEEGAGGHRGWLKSRPSRDWRGRAEEAATGPAGSLLLWAGPPPALPGSGHHSLAP